MNENFIITLNVWKNFFLTIVFFYIYLIIKIHARTQELYGQGDALQIITL